MWLFDWLKPKNPKYGQVLKYNLSAADEEKTRIEWQKVEELLSLGKPSQLKQAVIGADKIVDYILTRLVTGSSLGERLKSARDLFERDVYNSLWEAHKVRNALVHESSYDPPYFVCKEVVNKFKEAILSLNIRIN